jgi:cell division protein ZapA
MSAQLQIRIQGRIYTLRSQQSEQQIQKVVAFAEEKLAETAAGRSVDTVDLMILTLLNLAGEHLLLQEKKAQDDREIDQRLGLLERQLLLEIDDNFGC